MVLKGTPDTGDYLLKTVIVISLVNCVLSKALNACMQPLGTRQMISVCLELISGGLSL